MKEIDDILGMHSKLENNYIYDNVMSELVIPLKKVTIKYLADERSIPILERIVDIEDAFDEIKNIKKIYSSLYNDLAKTLRKKRKLMVKAIDYFEQPRWFKSEILKYLLNKSGQGKP